jgi:hypothetical protein
MVESCMDFSVSSWFVFYLKCDKRRDNNLYQIYIELCYFYVLVFFFYKVRILSILCSNSRVDNAFCYKMIVGTGKQ